MCKAGKSLKELCAGMEKYPQIIRNIHLGQVTANEIMNSDPLDSAVKGVEAELNNSGRVLIRPSGTEPLIRVMIEGQDQTHVENLAGQLVGVVEQLVAEKK
ncbi:MAG: hypothetical protein GY934_20205 [Gammaproteobacteria bacterium]|nr:hypothetical protein [Gammaproteobacteria bacterium]